MNERTERDTRIARYVASGIPAETASALVAYELSHAGRTSTLDSTGKRVVA